MERTAYFLDWRPVGFLPASEWPISSNTKTEDQIVSSHGRNWPLAGRDHDDPIVAYALESIGCRWRDDGLVLFHITISETFIETLKDLVSNLERAKTNKELKVAVGTLDLRRILFDRVTFVPNVPSGGLSRQLVPHPYSLDWVFAHLGRVVSAAVRQRTGYSYPFGGPNGGKIGKSDSIFLRVEPIRLDPRPWSPVHQDPAIFLTLLGGDKELLEMDCYVRRGVPSRKALFQLRAGFADLLDACVLLIAESKKQHFLARLFRIRWPASFIVIFGVWPVILFAAQDLVNWDYFRKLSPPLTKKVSEAFAAVGEMFNIWFVGILSFLRMLGAVASEIFPWLTKITPYALFFTYVVVVFGIFFFVEFVSRRGRVQRLLDRTAGYLEYGAVLGNVVSIASANAAKYRVKDDSLPDQTGAAKIIQRLLDEERDKRDRGRERFALVFAVVMGLISVVGVFKNEFSAVKKAVEANQPVAK